jgi:hypothetical protein
LIALLFTIRRNRYIVWAEKRIVYVYGSKIRIPMFFVCVSVYAVVEKK